MLIQDLILNQFLHNEDFFHKALPHIKNEYFEGEPERVVFGLIDSYAQKYNSRPTAEAIAILAEESKIPEGIWEKVIDLVGMLETPAEPQNYKWLLSQTEQWMRDRACYNVIMDAVNIYSNKNRRQELSTIPELLAEATIVGFDDDLGEIYWEMAGEHYDYMHSEQTRIPFTVEILNKITNGGVWRKCLCALTAGINVGKTTGLIDLAAQYASQGYDVIYFTFEVQQHGIRHRMDCRVLDRDFQTVEALPRHQYLAMIENMRKKGWGNIFIKEYPSGGAHAGHCRAYVKDLMKRKNVKPTVLLFDYIGEMASERLPVAMIGKSDLYQGSIARELRSLAFEFDCAGWTATQFQRGMQNTKDMDLSGNADSITVPKVLDLQIGLAVPDEYAALNQAWGTVMKNRFANKNKMKNFLIGLNQDFQKLFDVDPELQTFAAGELNTDNIGDSDKVESVPGAPKTSIRKSQKLDRESVNKLVF
jgi:hypothetical protein